MSKSGGAFPFRYTCRQYLQPPSSAPGSRNTRNLAGSTKICPCWKSKQVWKLSKWENWPQHVSFLSYDAETWWVSRADRFPSDTSVDSTCILLAAPQRGETPAILGEFNKIFTCRKSTQLRKFSKWENWSQNVSFFSYDAETWWVSRAGRFPSGTCVDSTCILLAALQRGETPAILGEFNQNNYVQEVKAIAQIF